MVTVSQNVLVVVLAVCGSLLFMVGLNRVWPPEKRRAYNDLIGWQVLCTTYAVILGFMLYTVWTAYGEADVNVDLEASSLVDIYRLTDKLPEPQRTQFQRLARSYADAVVDRDWPEMANNEEPKQSGGINTEMWETVMAVRPASPTEVTAQDHAFSELSSLNQHRLTRLLQSTTGLPNILWCVLLVGGALTIVATCTFGLESLRLQTLQIFSFSSLVSLSLVAIADIHRHFHGLIRVDDYAFRQAQQAMQVR